MNKSGLFLCIGFALFIFSTALTVQTQRQNSMLQSTVGMVTDIQPSPNNAKAFHLTITFDTPDGQRVVFSPDQSFSQNQYRKDQMVSLYFPKNQPQNVSLGSVSSQWVLILLLETLAVIMMVFFGGKSIKTYLQKKQMQMLKANGTQIHTTPIRVELLYRNKKGKARCCIVSCSKNTGDTSYEFKTDPIEKEPEFLLTHYRHHTITVYVDKDNIQNYIVDMSFLNQPAQSEIQNAT